jgi:hypothetical protein
MQDIDAWVATMPYSLSQPGWDSVNSQDFNVLVDKAQQAVLTNLSNQISGDATLTQIMQGWTSSVTKDGWAMAGGFQQRRGVREEMAKIYSAAPADATAPTFSGMPDDLARNCWPTALTQQLAPSSPGPTRVLGH